jgi:hypothetical protein
MRRSEEECAPQCGAWGLAPNAAARPLAFSLRQTLLHPVAALRLPSWRPKAPETQRQRGPREITARRPAPQRPPALGRPSVGAPGCWPPRGRAARRWVAGICRRLALSQQYHAARRPPMWRPPPPPPARACTRARAPGPGAVAPQCGVRCCLPERMKGGFGGPGPTPGERAIEILRGRPARRASRLQRVGYARFAQKWVGALRCPDSLRILGTSHIHRRTCSGNPMPPAKPGENRAL